jgi:hypothetical protein
VRLCFSFSAKVWAVFIFLTPNSPISTLADKQKETLFNPTTMPAKTKRTRPTSNSSSGKGKRLKQGAGRRMAGL